MIGKLFVDFRFQNEVNLSCDFQSKHYVNNRIDYAIQE